MAEIVPQPTSGQTKVGLPRPDHIDSDLPFGDRIGIQHQFDRPWQAAEARGGRLVVIGRKGIDQDAIRAGIAGQGPTG